MVSISVNSDGISFLIFKEKKDRSLLQSRQHTRVRRKGYIGICSQSFAPNLATSLCEGGVENFKEETQNLENLHHWMLCCHGRGGHMQDDICHTCIRDVTKYKYSNIFLSIQNMYVLLHFKIRCNNLKHYLSSQPSSQNNMNFV